MNQKRHYIVPEVTTEQWLGKECWMTAGLSTTQDPAPARRTPAF
ncbi:MAG: hypothetical protein SPF23_02945 [Paludibacteraceae bacterium]|nr:hypothetical protein [Paludibacteraceae bacterium]